MSDSFFVCGLDFIVGQLFYKKTQNMFFIRRKVSKINPKSKIIEVGEGYHFKTALLIFTLRIDLDLCWFSYLKLVPN